MSKTTTPPKASKTPAKAASATAKKPVKKVSATAEKPAKKPAKKAPAEVTVPAVAAAPVAAPVVATPRAIDRAELESIVRAEAHSLALARGFRNGSPFADWIRAEAAVLARLAAEGRVHPR